MPFSMTDIASAFQNLKVIKHVLEAHQALKSFNEAQTALADVHMKLMEFETAYDEVKDRAATQAKLISELQDEIKQLKDWSSERKNYEFIKLAGGVSAYRLKTGVESDEPVRNLCTNCFENRNTRSTMQQEHIGHASRFSCGGCGYKLTVM